MWHLCRITSGVCCDKASFFSWGLLSRGGGDSWIEHSLRGGKGGLKFLQRIACGSVGVWGEVLHGRVMLKTATQHSWGCRRLYNCLLLLNHRCLSGRLFPGLVACTLDINLSEVDLRDILQPPLLQCGIRFFHWWLTLLGVIWVIIFLVNCYSSSSVACIGWCSIWCHSLLVLDNLLGDGIVLEERLILML